MVVQILALGVGAIGALHASRLAQAAKASVSVICRSNYEAVKANGFSIKSPVFGSYNFKPENTFSSAQAAATSKIQWDFIMVSTKALPDVSDDSKLLEDLMGDKTAIVLVQNGLGIEAPYQRRFPNAPILSAITLVSAGHPEPGEIHHFNWTKTSVGPYTPDGDDSAASEKCSEFVELLRAGGMEDAQTCDHRKLQMLRWHKVAVNAAMNSSAVLSYGSPNAVMCNDQELYIHLKGVMDEVLNVAPKMLGSSLPEELPTPEKVLDNLGRDKTGSRPSMLMDWEQGKPMEVEVILGNPVRQAREKGLDMPRVQSLYALLRKTQENRFGVAKKEQEKL